MLMWSDVAKACRLVADQVRRSRWEPGLIVAVSSGGFVPAHLIAKGLGVEQVTAFGVRDNGDALDCYSTPTFFGKPATLVVTDVVGTGREIRHAVAWLQAKGLPTRAAALYRRPKDWRVEYTAQEADDIPVMPWD